MAGWSPRLASRSSARKSWRKWQSDVPRPLSPEGISAEILQAAVDATTVYAYTSRWFSLYDLIGSPMSTAELLIELAKLSPAERQEIVRRLSEMDRQAIDLRVRGIDAGSAAELRARLERFAEDWDSPEMAAYDHYDAARSLM